jgi:hypothetical protein
MMHAKIHITWHISPSGPISIWIVACIILFIIYYQARIVVNSEVYDYRLDCRDVLFHCDVIDMHYLHAC